MATRDQALDNRNEAGAEDLAEAESSETPEQRAKCIAQLQKEISDGTYKVDTRKLAAKMVEAHRKQES